MGTSSNQALGKRCKRNLEPQEGVFSRFSDEFIVDELLTRLSFKEAVRTSVLSRRWQKLWTHRSFIFDSDCLHYDSKNPNPEERSREQQFVQVVNHCLELHQNPSLNFLCIDFDLDYGFSSMVDGWLQFAFRKGVLCLCLSLQDRLPFSQNRNQCVFPGVETLKKQLSTTSSPLDNYNNCNTSKLLCAGISNLRSFDLTGVDINHEALEYLLSKSPFLETLCLSKCNNLVDLKLPSEAYSLKSVMVTRCRDMKRLVITKSNLTSLSISGSKITLSLENVPLLSLLSLCGEFCEIFLLRLSLHLSLLSQLKTLKLYILRKTLRESVLLHQEVPELSNLEHLHINMFANGGFCLLWPIILVKAAPFLRKLSVKFDFFICDLEAPASTKLDPMNELIRRRLQESTKYTHQCLRVVELDWFSGSENEMEFAEKVLHIAKSLNKLVLNFRPSIFRRDSINLVDKHLNELRRRLPSSAELVIFK